jgi:hypothetical protein
MGLNPSDTNIRLIMEMGQLKNTQAQLESSVYYNANPSASNFLYHIHLLDLIVLWKYSGLTIATSCGSTYLTAGPIIILDVPVSFNVIVLHALIHLFISDSTVAGYTNDCSTFNV